MNLWGNVGQLEVIASRMKKHKSPGVDDIASKLLNETEEQLVCYLEWKEANIITLLKKEK